MFPIENQKIVIGKSLFLICITDFCVEYRADLKVFHLGENNLNYSETIIKLNYNFY